MKLKINTVVMPLIGLNIFFFILQMMLGSKFIESLVLTPDIFIRPWILVTHIFLHGSISHLFFNMYALLLFGPLLEYRIGAKRFLLIYLLSGIVAGFGSSFFYSASLGASGAIMGMIGVIIILLPHLRLLFLFIIPMPLWVAGIVWAAIDLFGVIGLGPGGIGNIAHLVGMGCGLLYGVYLKVKKKKYVKKFHSKHHLDEDDVEEYFKNGKI